MTRSIHAFTDDALGRHDAVGLAAEIAAGRVSADEAIDASLARADAVNGELNAILTPAVERARAMAATGPTAMVQVVGLGDMKLQNRGQQYEWSKFCALVS